MDFELVLRALLAEFRRHKIRYAAIGGFALGVLGYGRATMDLDFLVHRDDLEKLHERLTALGYERLIKTENSRITSTVRKPGVESILSTRSARFHCLCLRALEAINCSEENKR